MIILIYTNIEQLREHAVYCCEEILLPLREVGLGWVELSWVGFSGNNYD